MSSRLYAVPHRRKQRVFLAIERQIRQAVAEGRQWSDPLLEIADDLHSCGAVQLTHRDYEEARSFLLAAFLVRRLIRGAGDLNVLLFASHLALSLDLCGSGEDARELRAESLRRFQIIEAINFIKSVHKPVRPSTPLH